MATFNKQWSYFLAGDQTLVVEDATKYILPCITFAKIPDSGNYIVQHNSIYGDFPVPKNDWCICLFKFDDPLFHMTNAIGLTFGKKCTVGWRDIDTSVTLGLRIWHESLHAMGGDADGMVTSSSVEFGNWLKQHHPDIADAFIQNPASHDHDPNYEKYYYLFLTAKMNPACEPAALVCDFDATPKSGNAPLTVSFTDKSIGSPADWRWSINGGLISTYSYAVYTIQTPGTYTVTLKVSNLFGSSTAMQTITVTVKKSLFTQFIEAILRLFGR